MDGEDVSDLKEVMMVGIIWRTWGDEGVVLLGILLVEVWECCVLLL